MAKVAVGSIPEKITYVSAPEREVNVGCEWDISWHNSPDEPKTVKEKVLPAFPVDSTDDKTMKRAVDWASRGTWDHTTNTVIKQTHAVMEVENKPIKNVKVLSLEQRGEGGRAYKALIDKFYIDLREDVLVDTLLQSGVEPGGILKGEYVWAKLRSQMKLVRVGSELHRLIKEFDSKKDIKPVGKRDLEVGGVYQDRKKDKAIFVGYVNSVAYKDEDPMPYYNRRDQIADFKYKKTPIKKSLLFYTLYDHVGLDESVKNMKKPAGEHFYTIRKTHTFIEKIDQVKIPENIPQYLRERAVKEIKEKILQYTGHISPPQGYAKIDSAYLENSIEYHSVHLNLYEYGGTEVEPFDVKKFLIFS